MNWELGDVRGLLLILWAQHHFNVAIFDFKNHVRRM